MYCHDSLPSDAQNLNDAAPAGYIAANSLNKAKTFRLHGEARTRAFAENAKRPFKGPMANEQLGALIACYRPASDVRVEVRDGKIFVSPVGVPSEDHLTRATGGYPTDLYKWSEEDGAICVRQLKTAAETARWVAGGTANSIFDARNAGHEALWARWRAAQGRAA